MFKAFLMPKKHFLYQGIFPKKTFLMPRYFFSLKIHLSNMIHDTFQASPRGGMRHSAGIARGAAECPDCVRVHRGAAHSRGVLLQLGGRRGGAEDQRPQ